MRPRDDVHRDELADAARGRGARVGGRLDGRDVAAHDGGHIAGADLLPADQRDLRGLDHGVGRLDHRDQALGFDHPQRLTHHCLLRRWRTAYPATSTARYRRFLIASSMSAVSSRYVNRISPSSSARGRGAAGVARRPAPAAARRRRRLDDLAVAGSPRPAAVASGIGADRRRRRDAVRARAAPAAAATSSRAMQVLAPEQPRDEADLREVLDRLHLVVRGEEVRRRRVSAPWLASSMPSCALMYLPDRLGQLRASTASRTPQSECCRASSAPRRARRGRAECRPRRSRWRSADARGRPPGRRAAAGRPRGASASRTRDRGRPASFRPSRSVMHIMSGVMKPLQTLFGVMSRRSAPSRTLMLPSFEAV